MCSSDLLLGHAWWASEGPGARLRLRFDFLPSFRSVTFCYITPRIVSGSYLVFSTSFVFELFLLGRNSPNPSCHDSTKFSQGHHHTFLLGFPTDRYYASIKHIFWRRCRGEEALLQGESLTSNLFTLLLFCLFYFRLLCYIKNKKKLVIAFILVV